MLKSSKRPTFHIETPAEMENINFGPYNRIGVSAGASTPNWIIDRVMDKIMEGQSRKLKKIGKLLNLWILAIKTDVYSALGAGCLCLACMLLQGIPVKLSFIAIASFFVYAMHVLNRLDWPQAGRFDWFFSGRNLPPAWEIIFLHRFSFYCGCPCVGV